MSKDTMARSWSAVWAAVGGRRGVKVAQDVCDFRELGGGWAMGVLSDGAGSTRWGGEGAALLVTEVMAWAASWSPEAFRDLASWRAWLEPRLDLLYASLLLEARSLRVEVKALAATLMLAFTHVDLGCFWWQLGDGRAACLNRQGDWEALFRPFKGKMANETIFFDSPAYRSHATMGHYAQPVRAWTLLSDGCEQAAFEVNIWNAQIQKLEDPNRPFPSFFQANLDKLQDLAYENQGTKNQLWRSFLNQGNEALAWEPDDKSMILALAL